MATKRLIERQAKLADKKEKYMANDIMDRPATFDATRDACIAAKDAADAEFNAVYEAACSKRRAAYLAANHACKIAREEAKED